VEPQPRCPSCGEPVADDRDFCDSCGAYLRWDDDDAARTAVLEPQSASGSVPTPAAPDTSAEPAAEPEPESTASEDDVVVRLRRPDGEYGSTAAVELAVDPGARATLIGLVRNRSGIVEHYDLELLGLPRDWSTITPPSLDLVPFGSGDDAHEAEATIELHPPRTCEAAAGRQALRLVARSRTRGVERESNEALLQITRFEHFESRLRPARVRGKRNARFDLPVRNRGNAPLVLIPRGEDDEGELQFTVEPPRLEIPPCGEGRAVVHASAPRLRSGPERVRTLTVHLEGAEQTLTGTAAFHQEPEPSVTPLRLSLWRVLLTLLGAGLLIGASFAHWTASETGVCTDGPETCLRYDTYLEGDLDIDVASPGDLGEFTRLFNFGTSIGVLTLLAGALLVLGALTGRLAWFAGLLALAVLTAFAVTADESLGAGVWLGFLGAAAALGSAVLATMVRRSQ
jgi:hypothetical protein